MTLRDEPRVGVLDEHKRLVMADIIHRRRGWKAPSPRTRAGGEKPKWTGIQYLKASKIE